jgi:hypothetical protein
MAFIHGWKCDAIGLFSAPVRLFSEVSFNVAAERQKMVHSILIFNIAFCFNFVFFVFLAVTPTRIILDESVIPRRYAHVLMQALYLDTVDMNCIVRSGCNESSSSSTTEETPNATSGASGGLPATTTGLPVPRPAPPTLFEEATELYQVI